MSPRPAACVLQLHLLGGVDVLRASRRRATPLYHAPSVPAARALVRASRSLLVTLPDFGARARCPRCGHEGGVLADFGFRPLRGQLRRQSWCRRCRATHQEVRDLPPPWAVQACATKV